MKQVLTRQVVAKGKLKAMGIQMVSILKDIERPQTDTVSTKQDLKCQHNK